MIKINKNFRCLYLFDILATVIILIIKIYGEFNIMTMQFIGILLILVSILNCLKTKKNKNLFFLMTLIAFINISIAIYDMILNNLHAPLWQINNLRFTSYNFNFALSLLVSNTIFGFFIYDNNKIKTNTEIKMQNFRKNNKIICNCGCLSLLYILMLGFKFYMSKNDSYVSVSNPIFEYSIMIVLLVWYYSKDYRIVNLFIKIYMIVFFCLFTILGDRSSTFMMAIMYYQLYLSTKISNKKLIIYVLFFLLIGKTIGIIRTSNTSIDLLIYNLVNKGFYVDTFSYSYYAGISFVALYSMASNKSIIGISYFLYQFGIKFGNYWNISVVAKELSPLLYNQGGGMLPGYIYSFSGFFGVILFSILIGIILRKFYVNAKNKDYIYQMLITSMVFRWYLYSPTTLTKSILVYFTLIFFIVRSFNKICERRQL